MFPNKPGPHSKFDPYRRGFEPNRNPQTRYPQQFSSRSHDLVPANVTSEQTHPAPPAHTNLSQNSSPIPQNSQRLDFQAGVAQPPATPSSTVSSLTSFQGAEDGPVASSENFSALTIADPRAWHNELRDLRDTNVERLFRAMLYTDSKRQPDLSLIISKDMERRIYVQANSLDEYNNMIIGQLLATGQNVLSPPLLPPTHDSDTTDGMHVGGSTPFAFNSAPFTLPSVPAADSLVRSQLQYGPVRGRQPSDDELTAELTANSHIESYGVSLNSETHPPSDVLTLASGANVETLQLELLPQPPSSSTRSGSFEKEPHLEPEPTNGVTNARALSQAPSANGKPLIQEALSENAYPMANQEMASTTCILLSVQQGAAATQALARNHFALPANEVEAHKFEPNALESAAAAASTSSDARVGSLPAAKSRNRHKQREEKDLEKTFKYMFKKFKVQWLYSSISYGKRAFYDIRNTTNMATIQEKLQSGKYKDLREVVVDFRRMFDKVTSISRKLTPIFKWYFRCYQVFKLFMKNIDRKIQLPGSRGRKYKTPSCNGKQFSILAYENKRFASCMQNEVQVNNGPALFQT